MHSQKFFFTLKKAYIYAKEFFILCIRYVWHGNINLIEIIECYEKRLCSEKVR